jgi:hypothetical protein
VIPMPLLRFAPSAALCLSISAALCLNAAFAAAMPAATAIKIDTVADKYAVLDFSFEVDRQTGRAGIRIEYTYPPARLGGDDSDRGPAPKIATLPGLTYDATARSVMYNDGAKMITCATAADHRTLFGKSTSMKPTGACTVSSRLTDQKRDDGWSLHRLSRLDVFFEAQTR